MTNRVSRTIKRCRIPPVLAVHRGRPPVHNETGRSISGRHGQQCQRKWRANFSLWNINMRPPNIQRSQAILRSAAVAPLARPQRIEMRRHTDMALVSLGNRTFERPHGRTPPTPQLYSLNAQRNAHGLIDTLRVRMTVEPGTEAHLALGHAARSLAQSAITGKFGDARLHLRAAMSSSPDQIRGQIKQIDSRCNSSDTPIQPDGHSVERIGAQVLAGIICAKLLNNETYAGSQPTTLVSSLSGSAVTAASDALMGKLVGCRSKDQVRERLVDFVNMFKLGDLQLPKGRISMLDEARSALEYCESFVAGVAGRDLSAPARGPNLRSSENLIAA